MKPDLLKIFTSKYPRPAIAIRLLIVRLTIIPTSGGKIVRTAGGGKEKNSDRYAPTIKPIGRAPVTQAVNLCFRRMNMINAAIKFAKGPSITSDTPKK